MDPDLWVSKGPYVYEQVIPFSSIRGNASSGWYPWEDRCVRISGAAELIALKPEVAAIDPLSSLAARNERFIVDCLDASKVEIVEVDYEEDPDGQVLDLQGLVIKCSTLSDEDTCFRVLLNKTDIRPFVRALRIVSKYHNLDKVWTTQLRVTRSEDGDGSILLPYFMSRNNRSVVRRSVMFVKGPGDMRTRQQRIMWKRGAFKFLPIFFHSDQLHGAW